MQRLILALVGILLATSCSVKSEPSLVSKPIVAPAVAPVVAPDGIIGAIATWRAAPRLSGRYRMTIDSAIAIGKSKEKSERTMLQIQEGTFASAAPDRFRTTGTSKAEFPGQLDKPMEGPKGDILFANRTAYFVVHGVGSPSVASVTKIAADLFKEGSNFKLKRTVVRNAPCTYGDVASTVEDFSHRWTFGPGTPIEENGIKLTMYAGEASVEQLVDGMFKTRDDSVGVFVEALQQNERGNALLNFQLQFFAKGLQGERHARIYVDTEGLIRGWDIGPEPGRWALQMRLSDIVRSADDSMFTLDNALMAQAVDQTPALAAQVTAMSKAFDDPAAVAAARSMLLEAVKPKAPSATSPAP